MDQLFTPCVFLVDDDEDDRFLVQLVFKQHSPECSLNILHSGDELLRALASATIAPTLILLDLNMPCMGGFDVLELIRQEPAYDSIPIMILTTSNQETDRQRAFELKAHDFITKPSSIEELNQIVLGIKRDWLIDQNVRVVLR